MTHHDGIDELRGRPFGPRMLGYLKLSGPGYMQSAMTLGGGSIASCAILASTLGYELLWVQPLAMLFGYFILANIAKQTCATGRRPYDVFRTELHVAFAVLWGLSAFVATIIWHIPQYSLAANGVVALAEGAGVDLETASARVGIGAGLLLAAIAVMTLYHLGARGIAWYERAIKLLVWGIVVAFGIVVFRTGIDWGRLVGGVSGINFFTRVLRDGVPAVAISPIIAGMAATVGINMVFLYPYSLLNKGYGKKHKELAYFDLLTGMALPFLLATSFMMIAVANTIGPAPGEIGVLKRDIRDIVPVLAPTLGLGFSWGLIGIGMLAIGFSTIVTHMLACGFIGCEMLGLKNGGRAAWLFSLAPAVGVVGVAIKFPLTLGITASTLAMPLMPITVGCFLVLLNRPSYMGDAAPRGLVRFAWNAILLVAVTVLGVAALIALKENWGKLQDLLHPTPPPQASVDAETLAPAPGQQTGESAVTASPLIRTEFTHAAMATQFEFIVYYPEAKFARADIEAIAHEAFAAIDELEDRLSSWDPASQVSEINRQAGKQPVKVALDVFEAIRLSKRYNEQTYGAFDITVGPLLDLWGITKREGRIPSAEEIAGALALVGMDKVLMDPVAQTVGLTQPGMHLDFGGVGKGMALDEAGKVLRRYGITTALLNGGASTMLALGAPPSQDGWTVHLPNPYNESQRLDTLRLRDAAFSSSVCYGLKVAATGESVCHIVDPRSGYSVPDVLAVAVTAATGAQGDALSTGLLAMGREDVIRFSVAHPEIGIVFVPMPPSGDPIAERINLMS